VRGLIRAIAGLASVASWYRAFVVTKPPLMPSGGFVVTYERPQKGPD